MVDIDVIIQVLLSDKYNKLSCTLKGCKSLLSAPELPATKMERSCYFRMFAECEKTTKDWLSGVAASGTFIKSKT